MAFPRVELPRLLRSEVEAARHEVDEYIALVRNIATAAAADDSVSMAAGLALERLAALTGRLGHAAVVRADLRDVAVALARVVRDADFKAMALALLRDMCIAAQDADGLAVVVTPAMRDALVWIARATAATRGSEQAAVAATFLAQLEGGARLMATPEVRDMLVALYKANPAHLGSVCQAVSAISQEVEGCRVFATRDVRTMLVALMRVPADACVCFEARVMAGVTRCHPCALLLGTSEARDGLVALSRVAATDNEKAAGMVAEAMRNIAAASAASAAVMATKAVRDFLAAMCCSRTAAVREIAADAIGLIARERGGDVFLTPDVRGALLAAWRRSPTDSVGTLVAAAFVALAASDRGVQLLATAEVRYALVEMAAAARTDACQFRVAQVLGCLAMSSEGVPLLATAAVRDALLGLARGARSVATLEAALLAICGITNKPVGSRALDAPTLRAFLLRFVSLPQPDPLRGLGLLSLASLYGHKGLDHSEWVALASRFAPMQAGALMEAAKQRYFRAAAPA